ncbi:MAG: N-acetylmuramoyl-L-alanine amidase family protein [Patescibacteria group bacterium]
MAKTVVLDPGHQSSPYLDTGASGYGLKEENITLDLCKRIKPLLEQNNIKVIMTREGDYVNGGQSSVNSSLQARVKISNTIKPDIFISLHTNAFNGNAYGSEVHILGKGGKAEVLANKLIPQLSKTFHNRGLKLSPNLYVLKYTNAPAVLLECGFIDNKSDNAKLANTDIRQQIAENLVEGICGFFGIEKIKSTIQSSPPPSPILEGGKIMNVCIVYYSPADFSSALILSQKYNNCAMFCRNASTNVNPDALKASKIFTVGGSKLGIDGEIYLSGNSAADTLIAVANYLKNN